MPKVDECLSCALSASGAGRLDIRQLKQSSTFALGTGRLRCEATWKREFKLSWRKVDLLKSSP